MSVTFAILAALIALLSLLAPGIASGQEPQTQADLKLREYLHRNYPGRLTRIVAGKNEVDLEGAIPGGGGEWFLEEIPIQASAADLKEVAAFIPIRPDAAGRFTGHLPRRVKDGSIERDRLLARWAVVRKEGSGYSLVSPARYASQVEAASRIEPEKPRNKKGLGALWFNRPVSDLDDLQISAVTVNVRLNDYFRTRSGPGTAPFQYGGRTWFAETNALEGLDRTLVLAARRRLLVSAIILMAPARGGGAGDWDRLAAHPDADPAGIYVMPNVASEEGAAAYGAALDFLARRYSDPEKTHGFIHYWIMHNEVDAGWKWTNAGDKSALSYFDLYHKSMRLADLIARQYNPQAKVFISLTHYWTMKGGPHFYSSRALLELLLEFCAAEGDFDWGIAYHPYPQDLRNPRVWGDQEVRYDFETPKITFKNLEVLDAWVKQPRVFFRGERRRTVHLTEQGLNSPDYSERSLLEQAAGLAYAWKKIERLDSIELFHYHNWVDNRGEGGLRIGLRKFSDDAQDPLGKKPIWRVYRAVGTPEEEAGISFAKPIVGIADWSEIIRAGPIR